MDASYHAQVARGHALHAHEHANEASKDHARQDEGTDDENYAGFSRNGSQNGEASRWSEDEDDEANDSPRYSARGDEDEEEDTSSSGRSGRSALGRGRKKMSPPPKGRNGRETESRRSR